MNHSHNDATDPFLIRPHDHLVKFPVDIRWELTRRHPYYLALWKDVRDFRNKPPKEPDRYAYGLGAMYLLAGIGAEGPPMPPTSSNESVCGADPHFLGSSIQPPTIRRIVGLLLAQLSPSAKELLHRLFADSVEVQSDIEKRTLQGLDSSTAMRLVLARAQLPELDVVFEAPLFVLNPEASQETIMQDVNRLARYWKSKLRKPSPKIHTGRILKNLEVWDRYEGWKNGRYHIGSEATLKQIAKVKRASPSTIHDQYRAAFRDIIGHEFSPDLWWKVMGQFKIKEYARKKRSLTDWIARRLTSRSQMGLVPESRLLANNTCEQPRGPIQALVSDQSFIEIHDLVNELKELIQAGKSNSEIKRELDFRKKEADRLIDYFRNHADRLSAIQP